MTAMTATKARHADSSVSTRGVHHLALNTDDMKSTIDFYVNVMGMPLVHAMRTPPGVGTGEGNRGNPPYEQIRHYLFDMGNDSLLAFFEIPKGEKEVGDRDAIAAMQHVAFAVTKEKADEIRARLDERDISYAGPVEALPGLFSIYFYDNNGIRLEVATHPAEGDELQVIRMVKQTREEAVEELKSLEADPDWLAAATAALD